MKDRHRNRRTIPSDRRFLRSNKSLLPGKPSSIRSASSRENRPSFHMQTERTGIVLRTIRSMILRIMRRLSPYRRFFPCQSSRNRRSALRQSPYPTFPFLTESNRRVSMNVRTYSCPISMRIRKNTDTTDRTGPSDRLWRRGPTGVRAPSGKAFRPWSRRR